MEPRSNIFGIPQYVDAIPGRQFCDYNLLRITICPKCYFASAYSSDFLSQSSIKKDQTPPFAVELVQESWDSAFAQRRKALEPFMDGMFSEKRSPKQALVSYNLAVSTTNELLKAELTKKPRSRDYSIALKTVNYLLFKAELLMKYKKKAEAEKLANSALAKLSKIFPFLEKESSIKAAFLMGMLGLYFENSAIVSRSISFLQQYDKNNRVKFGTEEQKSLGACLQKMNTAYQSRDEFNRRRLNGFDKPFEY